MLSCLRFPHILQITKHTVEESIYEHVQNITLMEGSLEYMLTLTARPQKFLMGHVQLIFQITRSMPHTTSSIALLERQWNLGFVR